MPDTSWDTVEDAIAAIGRGSFVLVADAADRENEGDLVMAAECMTEEAMAFLVRHSSGIVCVGLEEQRARRLELPLMVADPAANTECQGTAFTVSVDARRGLTTGISAAERAMTVRTLADRAAGPADFTRPGHVFPLRARPGGALKRAGHTESAVDLARLAGREPAGALCELVNDDGSMARRGDLARFATRHGIPRITIDQLITYRRRSERLVERVSSAPVGTPYGPATVHAYRSVLDGIEHVAVVHGDLGRGAPPLVRVHSECLTGDVFGSARCDCGAQLRLAQEQIAAAGGGVVVYLRGQEGRGIGLGHKLRAYTLQDQGRDTVDANLDLGLPVDTREYGIGAQILADLGVSALRLLTNNPAKYLGLSGYGIEVVERVALVTAPTPQNVAYLRAKRERLGHLLAVPDPAATE
ncbi:MAG TPA: bifunctional 3,4-dihydroxy-2-butanone-4-phosphate synthase/GTP cyclohydrolase II, partial [Baekduia sp.]|nr:bifunctional 3,4-dihydroxy-2-butanone-4-phosphate synthase/GTP cyclohydrolase II [Baekduia sp.]